MRARFAMTFLAVALHATATFADVSVTASVDQRRVAFGETIVYTINVNGARGNAQPSIPPVDGLSFAGPSTQSSVSIINGQRSESVILSYQVTPRRVGDFTIPAVEVELAGKKYNTQPIQLTVEKGAPQTSMQDRLYGRIELDQKQLFLGQCAPVNLYLFARQDVPLKGFNGFQCEADGFDFKYLNNMKSGTKVINGETFNIFRIEGAITPTKTGKLTFGPCAIRTQLAVQKRSRRSQFDEPLFENFFGSAELREVPVTLEGVPIEVAPVPTEGKPADFTGAVGQWTLEVSAKPTEVAVGDPITLNVKVSGDGNIDTVPLPKLADLEEFKTYEPTTKTSKNDLNTQGTKEFQQVLIPKSTDVKQLPEVHLVYFDPVAKQYKTAGAGPTKLVVKAGVGGHNAIVSGAVKAGPREKLGQDIVYLKGDLGTAVATVPFCATPTFWVLNLAPVFGLLGTVIWKRRADKLRGDIAYARRSRAARNARKILDSATGYDHVQQALQQYLGDRLNIPDSGITTAIVDEQLAPRGVNGTLAERLKACFETCDSARFASATNHDNGLQATADKVRELIDELENQRL